VRSRVVRLSLLGVFAVVLVVGLWTGWQAWRVNEDLNAAVDDAADLEAALESSDQPAAEAALERLDEHTASAHDRTEGVTFGVLARLPVVGDDVAGVRLATDVINDLTNEALRPLVDEAADLESFLPQDGRIPVDRLSALQEPVSRARLAFEDGSARLDEEDSSSYLGPAPSTPRTLPSRSCRTCSASPVSATMSCSSRTTPKCAPRADSRARSPDSRSTTASCN
jgi:hypothetical protein